MAVDGQSKNTGLSKQYQAGVGDSFLRHVKEVSPQLSEQWGVDWGEVPEGAAASQEIYAHLMTYLVEIHEIAADRVPLAKRQLPGPHRYDWGSVDTLWNGLLHIQKMRFASIAPLSPRPRAGWPRRVGVIRLTALPPETPVALTAFMTLTMAPL